MVYEEFGLTPEQQQQAFFHMKPSVGESTAAFVLRVDSAQKIHDIKEDFTCYLVFSQHFFPEFAAKCESVKLNLSV